VNIPELYDYWRRLSDDPVRNYKAFQSRGFAAGEIWNEIVSDSQWSSFYKIHSAFSHDHYGFNLLLWRQELHRNNRTDSFWWHTRYTVVWRCASRHIFACFLRRRVLNFGFCLILRVSTQGRLQISVCIFCFAFVNKRSLKMSRWKPLHCIYYLGKNEKGISVTV